MSEAKPYTLEEIETERKWVEDAVDLEPFVGQTERWLATADTLRAERDKAREAIRAFLKWENEEDRTKTTPKEWLEQTEALATAIATAEENLGAEG